MRRTLISKISDRGQVSVPADIREALGLQAGSSMRWELCADGSARVTLWRYFPKRSAAELLGYAKNFRMPKRTEEWFK